MSQKSHDPGDLSVHVEHLTQLLCIGANQLEALADGDQKVQRFRLGLSWSGKSPVTTG